MLEVVIGVLVRSWTMEVDKATDENIQRNENILKSEAIAHDVLPVAMF